MNKLINFIRTKYKMIIIIVSVILIINVILMIYLIYRYKHRAEYTERPVAVIAEYEFAFDNWGEVLSAINVTESNSKKLTASKVSKSIETFATSFIPYINENVLKNISPILEELNQTKKEMNFKEFCIKLDKLMTEKKENIVS